MDEILAVIVIFIIIMFALIYLGDRMGIFHKVINLIIAAAHFNLAIYFYNDKHYCSDVYIYRCINNVISWANLNLVGIWVLALVINRNYTVPTHAIVSIVAFPTALVCFIIRIFMPTPAILYWEKKGDYIWMLYAHILCGLYTFPSFIYFLYIIYRNRLDPKNIMYSNADWIKFSLVLITFTFSICSIGSMLVIW